MAERTSRSPSRPSLLPDLHSKKSADVSARYLQARIGLVVSVGEGDRRRDVARRRPRPPSASCRRRRTLVLPLTGAGENARWLEAGEAPPRPLLDRNATCVALGDETGRGSIPARPRGRQSVPPTASAQRSPRTRGHTAYSDLRCPGVSRSTAMTAVSRGSSTAEERVRQLDHGAMIAVRDDESAGATS